MWKNLIAISLVLAACASTPQVNCPVNVERAVLNATDALCVTEQTRHGMVFECIHRNGKQYRIIGGDEV
jgi:hypothetical protein